MKEQDERRMPFLDHLGELRDRLRNSVIAVLLAAALCYFFRFSLFEVLVRPLDNALTKARDMGIEGQLVFINPMEAFMVLLKTALVSAIFLASPAIFHQLWAFIAPGLYPHEKRWAAPFILSAILLFVGGGLFCYYFVLPAGYEFFMTAAQDATRQFQDRMGHTITNLASIKPMISMEEYFGLTLMLLLVFGVVFELPLLLVALTLLGVVTADKLWRFNRYAIILFAICGALLTPGDLVIGQLAMTGSLTALYNLSIILAWVVEKRRKKADAESAAAA